MSNRLTRLELGEHQAALPPYPVQHWLTGPIRRAAAVADRPELLALWAGQNAPLVRYAAAADLMALLVADAAALMAFLVADAAARGVRW